MNTECSMQMNQGYSLLFSGVDPEENKRQTNKQQKQAHPEYCRLTQKQKERKQKKENKPIEQKSEEDQVYQTRPLFVSLVKPNNEEIQIDLEQYLNEEYDKVDTVTKVKYFAQENDYGQTEYKLRLFDPDPKRLTHLTTQMNFRLSEGNGMAHYKLGVEDSGHPLGLNKQDMLGSLRTLCTMASNLKAELLVVGINPGIKGKIAEIIVRKGIKDGVNMDIRIILLGESGSGKTSLLGVLSSGQLDDGKGLARMRFLRNKKEIQSGKTERVSHTIIGFDSEGKIINHQNQINFSLDCMVEKVVDLSSKLITFIDMGGTKRAHNQMIQIVNSQFPDYALLTISALEQMSKFTMDYFKLIQIQQVPFMIVISHIDQVSEQQFMELVDQLKQVIKSLQINSVPIVVRNEQDVVLFSKEILKKTLVPIFLISNLKQTTLDYFIKFLNLLPSTNELINNSNLHSEFCIHNVYEISNQNQKVLGGTVVKGLIRVGQILHLGPDKIGRFFPIEVEEIQCSRVKVKSAQCGQICTVRYKLSALSQQIGTDQNPIRKGMVLVEGITNPQAAWDFVAEIWLFDDSNKNKKISLSFEPVINTQYTRQICKIIKEENQNMEMPKLEKKHSKSIDQFDIDKQSFYQSKNSRKRKQSEYQIKHTNSQKSLIESRSPRRKCSNQMTQLSNIELNKVDLFVINEKQDKIQEYQELFFDKANIIRFKFKYFPEFITQGMKLIINEPNLQGWGFIKQINY